MMADRPSENLSFITELWFDETAAFNVTRIDSTIGGVHRGHIELSYQQHQGVYLPHAMLRETFDSQGRIRRRERFTLANSKLNEPLPADQFTLRALGLNDGERVIDRIEGGEYRYFDGNLTSQPTP